MLIGNYADIPDLDFRIGLLVSEGTTVAARLLFDCTPIGDFLGLPIDGRHVSFGEHAFYRFERGAIVEVWSVIDKAALEAQIG